MIAKFFITLLLAGMTAFFQGGVRAAEDTSNTPLAIPSVLSPGDQMLYDRAYNLIQTYSGTGDHLEKAFKILNDLAQRNPQSGTPIAGLADLKFRLASMGYGSMQEVLMFAQRAIKMDRRIAEPYIVVAKVMIEQNNIIAAQQAADRAIALAPEKPEAMFVKARAAERAERYEESEKWYLQAIERHTDRQRKANIYFWLGRMLRSKYPRDIPGAIKAYEKMVEFVDDKSTWALNEAGLFFLGYTDRYDQAIDCLTRSLKAAENGAARTNLGLAQFYKWGDAYIHPDKYKGAKIKPEDPKTITENTGVSPEYAFSKNPLAAVSPWATIAMIRSGLIKNVDVVAPGTSGTALTSAAYGNHLDVVKLLVSKGANVNAEDTDRRRTPVFYAVEHGNLEMVKFLVERGARINRVDGSKMPLTALAIGNRNPNDIRILSYLMEKGADPTIPDRQGAPLLSLAVYQGNVAVVRLLVQKYRVDPNLKFRDKPVLTLAAISGGSTAEIVQLLLSAGANPWVKDGDRDVLSTLADFSSVNGKIFPSFKQSMEMIQMARKSSPKPNDFGRAYGE